MHRASGLTSALLPGLSLTRLPDETSHPASCLMPRPSAALLPRLRLTRLVWLHLPPVLAGTTVSWHCTEYWCQKSSSLPPYQKFHKIYRNRLGLADLRWMSLHPGGDDVCRKQTQKKKDGGLDEPEDLS